MSLFQSVLAVTVLLGAYLLIVLDRLEGTIAAIIGATVLIVAGVLNQHEAIGFVDFNTIGLLAGMMLIVSVARKSGVFSYLAIRAAQLVRASPAGVLATFALGTALLSAFVNNITVVLLVVPVTFVMCDELGIGAYPFLFSEILASNIGGTATLIGDPPNILIGSATGLRVASGADLHGHSGFADCGRSCARGQDNAGLARVSAAHNGDTGGQGHREPLPSGVFAHCHSRRAGGVDRG